MAMSDEERRAYYRAYRAANAARINARDRERYRADAEKFRARKVEYRKADPETFLERGRAWRAANPEKNAEYGQRYRAENLEKEHTRDQARYAANPEKGTEKAGRRRALKAAADTGPTAMELFLGFPCPLCGEDIDETLVWPDPGSKSIDHIVPLSKGGSHTQENLQWVHLRCNLSKGARLPDEPDEVA